MFLRELAPSGGEHGQALVAQIEVALLLIVLDLDRSEDLAALATGISVLGLRDALEVGRVTAHLVVSADLFQGVLLAEHLALEELHALANVAETHLLLRLVARFPGLGMVPVGRLKVVLHGLVDDDTLACLAVRAELRGIHGVVALMHGADSEVGPSHFLPESVQGKCL